MDVTKQTERDSIPKQGPPSHPVQKSLVRSGGPTQAPQRTTHPQSRSGDTLTPQFDLPPPGSVIQHRQQLNGPSQLAGQHPPHSQARPAQRRVRRGAELEQGSGRLVQGADLLRRRVSASEDA